MALIGSDAMQHQMQLYNEDKHGEGADQEELALLGLEQEDPEVAEQKRQKMLQAEEQRERERQEAEDRKRQQMMNEWSERDRQKLKEAQDKININLEALKKEFNSDGTKSIVNKRSGMSDDQGGADDLALAIYDGGDPNSRHNQIVKAIENNSKLSEEEKENLLRSHQKQLMQIEDLMADEKRKQDLEMERALKSRIERRRKALENKHKKEIQAEIKEGEKQIKEENDRLRQEGAAQIEAETQEQMDELTNNLKQGQAQNYRQWVEELKR